MSWERHDCSGDPRTARAGHTATAVGKFVYVIGGRRGAYFYDDVLRYDAHRCVWEALPGKLPFAARANHTATLVERPGGAGREIWVVGGQTNDDVERDVWALELPELGRSGGGGGGGGGGAQHAWRRVKVRDDHDLLLRTAHSAEPHPRQPSEILIWGGYGGPGGTSSFLGSLAALDTAAGAVSELRPAGAPPTPRGYHSWTAVGHVCYVFGGRNAAGVVPARDATLLCAYDSLKH